MIRINLLPDHKLTTSDRGRQSLLIGLMIIVAAGVGVYFLHYKGIKTERDNFAREAKKQQKEVNDMRKTLSGNKAEGIPPFDEIKKKNADEEAREKKIAELEASRVNPNHVLRELSKIMTRNNLPTPDPMGDAYADVDVRWDPKRVWITELKEQGGDFTLLGGAQTPGDATQLASRMRASVYFKDINMPVKSPVVDGKTSTRYTKFKITGKLVY